VPLSLKESTICKVKENACAHLITWQAGLLVQALKGAIADAQQKMAESGA
jgi:hypothetical protein